MSPAPSLLAQQTALLQALLAPPHHPASAHVPFFDVANKSYGYCDVGLKAYKSNAGALAERVLVAAYPVVTAILSADSMGQLARALWHAHPPQRGDLAHWGGALPDFMAVSPQLAELPWLPDVARLEWALHQAETAADVPTDLGSLRHLAEQDPAALTLRLAPGAQVVRSSWAVVPVLAAHRHATHAEQAIAELGERWCAPGPAHALVWRRGHQPQCCAISPAEAALVLALLAGQALLPALEHAERACTDQGQSELDFAAWLPTALQQGWVLGVDA